MSVELNRCIAAAALWIGLCGAGSAHAFDPFLTERALSGTPAADMLDQRPGICAFGDLPQPLQLQDAVERALCGHPKSRQAWANVKIQAAAVGVARAAFLPTVNANWQGTRDNVDNHVTGYSQFDSNYRVNLQNASVSLSWVLYDFGGRSAALRNASALLAAAQANQQAALQTVFALVAKDFYTAQAAQGTLAAAREIEQAALMSADAATARVDRGVASISDQLQAQTAYAEAVVNRTKAESDLRSAMGALASDMFLAPTTGITLPGVGEGVTADRAFNDSIEELIKEAQRNYPGVLAAKAQLTAAHAKTMQIRAEGLPRLNLVGQYNYNNQPTSLQLGFPVFPASHREWYLGIQVTIPLFEGFARTYQVRQANAQAELQIGMLDEIRQEVGLDVWNAYQALQSATHNLGNSATLQSLAQRSYDASGHRYRMGVGNMLELLNAQSALAGAKRQRIQALTDWRSARLQLAAKLGKLGMWSLDNVVPH
ncbi:MULTISPECIES: TolC family protein [Burkholderia cepacia complex]|uniref:Protein CyaE n=2 Tax=Burkholderia cepacia complex TaxID=87882 RepID=A0AAW3MNC1_9BURK|nr:MULTISPECIES: TolC family protein [Burkholderia cepacia complex]AOK18974.1 Fis family transcriptional regulator [Burkholderia cepacia]AOK25730.1 Fis family transcriptional regulator [Burkholderia ubonensis]KVP93297.1 Fis family transcriptional regulator [Burkholderia ubonensis]KVU36228.1 Fis family transcriptional regulator [Burkholderia ubonensis]KVX23200.1 Fis family transcriptional regulator [Burkholderia ubonensis]